MSQVWGANADALDAAALQLDQAADQFDQSAGQLTSTLGAARWLGNIAVAFGDMWGSRHRPGLVRTAGFLRENATTLRQQASDQRRAANGDGTAPTIHRPPNTVGGLPGNWKWEQHDAPLFHQGEGDTDQVDPDDVVQGELGDCFLLANLKALAAADPDLIRRLIRDNGDGTYTVTLYDNGVPFEVVIDGSLPTKVHRFGWDDQTPFAEVGDGELWVRLVEKAVYLHYGEGYDGFPDGGNTSVALAVLTGKVPTDVQPSSMTDTDLGQLGARIDLDQSAATTGTIGEANLTEAQKGLYDRLDIVAGHAYAIERIDAESGTIYLDNPWGDHDLAISFDEYRQAFGTCQFVDLGHGGVDSVGPSNVA